MDNGTRIPWDWARDWDKYRWDSPGTQISANPKLWDKLGQEYWLSQSRPMGQKSLELLELGQKSLGQSRDFLAVESRAHPCL